MARRKQRVFDGKGCPYCGERMRAAKSDHPRFPTRDHLNPRSQGGGPTIIVCRQCNNKRGCMPLEDWIAYLMEERPRQVPAVVAAIRSVHFALTIPKESRLRQVLRKAQEIAENVV